MLGTEFSAQKAPERIDSIKDLVLEALRFRRPYRGALSPIFQPCGQGSFLEAVLSKMPRLAAGIHFLPCIQTTTMPLADELNIPNQSGPRNPKQNILVTTPAPANPALRVSTRIL
jgi:hypothetical protein